MVPVSQVLLKRRYIRTTTFLNKTKYEGSAPYTHICVYLMYVMSVTGARGGAVGRSRVRFPVVSMEFFIDIILSTALWPSTPNRDE